MSPQDIGAFSNLECLAAALGGEVSGDEVRAPGPGHSPQDRSLSIKLDDKAPDGFLVYSFAGDDAIACKDFVRAKLGLPEFSPKQKKKSNSGGAGKPYSPTVARYIYRDEHDQPYLRVDRTADKDFFQHRWNGETWVAGKPSGGKVPYLLPKVLAATPTTPIYICEGEKDCDNLAKLGFVATCNSGGADSGSGQKWTADLNQYFKDRHVYILADNDAPGRKHAQHVARNLDGIAASVRVIELPGLPPKGDVSDWLENDPTGARLVRECKAAPLWEPTAIAGASGDDDDLIAELADLGLLDYAKRRKSAAEQIGIGVVELDKIVAEARGEAPPATPERWSVEPWEQEVATGDLLQGLLETYKNYVILPDEHSAVAMALWCSHAWTIDAAYVSPNFMVKSPEMRCGKSTVLMLLHRTGPRTAFAANISVASVYRYIEACHPTLLIDEADTFARDDEALRGILNSGHTRDTAFVIRCEGDDNTPKEFSTWGPKAIAAIGKLAATLRDRSIILSMKRKKAGERITKLRAQDGEPFMTLRRKAARWAGDNLETLKAARPKIPQGLNDRAQDNWEPLLAIADLAGGNWPQLARAAAVKLSTDAEGEGDSIKVRLLADIRGAFERLGVERMTSAEMVNQLIADAAGPWLEYGRGGKPITQKKLASLLDNFEIKPKTMRVPGLDGTPKGYELAWFSDGFERYLPSPSAPTAFQSTTPQQVNDHNEVEAKKTATPDPLVADQNSHKPLELKDCCGVVDQYPPGSKTEAVGASCAQCNGPPDGTEQLHMVAGRTAWLHPECRRFYVEGHKS